jgi:hypothetical protein
MERGKRSLMKLDDLRQIHQYRSFLRDQLHQLRQQDLEGLRFIKYKVREPF